MTVTNGSMDLRGSSGPVPAVGAVAAVLTDQAVAVDMDRMASVAVAAVEAETLQEAMARSARSTEPLRPSLAEYLRVAYHRTTRVGLDTGVAHRHGSGTRTLQENLS